MAAVPPHRLEDLRLRRKIRSLPCWKAWRSPATSAPCSAAPTRRAFPRLMLAAPRTDLFNPNAIRASLGTIFSLPVAAGQRGGSPRLAAGASVANRRRTGGRFGRLHGNRLSAADGDRLRQRGGGAYPLWTGDDMRAVRLPMLGAADSLNVSAAAAVLFYEALRQRTRRIRSVAEAQRVPPRSRWYSARLRRRRAGGPHADARRAALAVLRGVGAKRGRRIEAWGDSSLSGLPIRCTAGPSVPRRRRSRHR